MNLEQLIADLFGLHHIHQSGLEKLMAAIDDLKAAVNANTAAVTDAVAKLGTPSNDPAIAEAAATIAADAKRLADATNPPAP